VDTFHVQDATSVAVHGDRLYVTHAHEMAMSVLDADTGELIERIGFYGSGGVAVRGDHIYVSTDGDPRYGNDLIVITTTQNSSAVIWCSRRA
jgi:hypothetical protein